MKPQPSPRWRVRRASWASFHRTRSIFTTARVLFEQNRFDEAQATARVACECLKKACELDPHSVSACGNLGEVYLALFCYDEALVALKHAIALDPQAQNPAGRRAHAHAHFVGPRFSAKFTLVRNVRNHMTTITKTGPTGPALPTDQTIPTGPIKQLPKGITGLKAEANVAAREMPSRIWAPTFAGP